MQEKIEQVIKTNNYKLSPQLLEDTESIKDYDKFIKNPDAKNILKRIYEYLSDAPTKFNEVVNKVHILTESIEKKTENINSHMEKLHIEITKPVEKKMPVPPPVKNIIAKSAPVKISAIDIFKKDLAENKEIYVNAGFEVEGDDIEGIYNMLKDKPEFRKLLMERIKKVNSNK